MIIFCCAPLFTGLDGWDQRNDEAIYSYAVDRILETGDWLTPRSIPTDEPFLEKPPLKFWMLAGPMWLGLIPHDDWGLRFVDAVLASLTFLYVYLIGLRLSGPLAGVVGAFLLFSFGPLLFEHGIRGNNMEGALLLAYAAGMFHFLRWADAPAGRGRRDALAVALCFVFAFMTKFVAAAFLPIIAGAAIVARGDWGRDALPRWRDWVIPAIVAIAAVAPWFVYQSIHNRDTFWHILFGQHVYERFAGVLVASHIRPWHHYFSHLWLEWRLGGSALIMTAGLLALVFRSVGARASWTARTLLLWFLLPMLLMSAGKSKLFYYCYPFLAPVALGAGLAVSEVIALASSTFVRRGLARLGLPRFANPDDRLAQHRWAKTLLILAIASIAVASWTFAFGPLTIEIGGVRLFRSSSTVRALAIGAVLFYWAGFAVTVLRIGTLSLMVAWLPFQEYHHNVGRLRSIDHPLRTTRDCALAVQASAPTAGRGTFWASGDLHHAFYYYLRRLGPHLSAREARPDELERRLEGRGEQTPVILSMDDYVKLGGKPDRPPARPGNETATAISPTTRLERGLPAGISIGDVVVILMPGPYEACAVPVAKAGSELLSAVAVPYGVGR
jgi:4-amino-4-deoxy-L-arabinose transferase-like glycosyltransferase